MAGSVQPHSRDELPRREVMQTPDEVAAMLRLKALGWGIRRIARELGCSHMTVRRSVAGGGWMPHRGHRRPGKLAGLEDWLAERFRRHAGNADVVRQELAAEHDIRVSLRTVERAVAPRRCGASLPPQRGRRSASRLHRANSCRSISVSAVR